ncbi:uncharacterized protein LOC141661365 isoform X3 [Apium graveolens]|uniref:uncharacterized protein LOC141661365 isoform X3 n=1 Tax=Apium graveolens TaxID=4045 RepID=UPI003D79229E
MGVDYSDDEVRADKNKLGYVAIPVHVPAPVKQICYEWGRRGSGAMFSLVSGMGGPNTAANVVTSGLFFALVQGGLFKLFVSSTSMPTCRKNFQRRSSSNFQGKEDKEVLL